MFVYNYFGKFGVEFSNNRSYTHKEIITLVKKNESAFIQLTNSMQSGIDTSFYAEHRGKENRYQLYYLDKDSIGDVFSIGEDLENKIFKVADSLDISQISKFTNENFYRIHLINNRDVDIQLFFLRCNERQFSAIGDKLFSLHPVIKNELELDRNPDSFFYKVNDRILIYFRNK